MRKVSKWAQFILVLHYLASVRMPILTRKIFFTTKVSNLTVKREEVSFRFAMAPYMRNFGKKIKQKSSQ